MHRSEYAKRAWWQIPMSYKRWLEEKVSELRLCLSNTHEATRAHRAQLYRDYGIVYDAPCDWYRKVTKGALDG